MSTLVGKKAPDFSAEAIFGSGEQASCLTLSEVVKSKYVLLFFYPLDFTFVCPSELLALNNRIAEFKSRNVEVIGISIDSIFTHAAWRNTPIEKGGIGAIDYTLVSDLKHNICQAYGIETVNGVAYRGTFLIDKEGTIRTQHVHDLPFGRNIDELIRLVDALQYHEKHGDVCPANWKKGKKGMKPTADGVANYLSDNAKTL